MRLYRTYRKYILNILLLIVLGCCFISFFPEETHALREFYQRDYMMDRFFRFRGNKPYIGMVHVLSEIKRGQSMEQTYVMGSYYHAIKFQIEPLAPNSSIVIMASEPVSPRIMRAIYAYDDMTYPVTLWTDAFWYPEYECNDTGCSKIRFVLTRGEVKVTVVDLR